MTIRSNGRTLAAAAALALWAGGTAHATDYAAEIEAHVVGACLRGLVEAQGGVPGMTDAEAVRLLRMMGRDQWDLTYGTVLPLVEGRPTEDRMTLYRTFAEHCVRSGTRGSGG